VTRQLRRLTAEEFLDWAAAQPQGRFELVGGEIVAMAPERSVHGRAKLDTTVALRTALAKAGLECEAIIDSVGVRVDEATVYVPDAFVRCGRRLPDDEMVVSDPVIVVEVVSPSSHAIDSGAKLIGYFRLPSVQHYLVVDAGARAVTHYRRDPTGGVAVRILDQGTLELDPPGFAVKVADFFASA
jgi:Uma2 family endonuclease